MNYSQSSLALQSVIFKKNCNPRVNRTYNPTGAIKKITIHHMAGKMLAADCAKMHLNGNTASANYYIGYDGNICSGVDESCRAWTSGSRENDYQAITIEVSNDVIGEPWHVSDEALESCIKLCVDMCWRNNIERINFTGDASGNLTQHCYFQATACPGTYLKSKYQYIADRINAELSEYPSPVPYAPDPTLRRGSKGERVMQLQKCFNYLFDSGLDVDGIYGPLTERAVKAYQQKELLIIDGIYGPKTYSSLNQDLLDTAYYMKEKYKL